LKFKRGDIKLLAAASLFNLFWLYFLKQDVMNENREHAVEAMIVKVMKSRKSLQFKDLLEEVHSLLRKFNASISLIKKRLESLTEREYLERDTKDINLYHYKS